MKKSSKIGLTVVGALFVLGGIGSLFSEESDVSASDSDTTTSASSEEETTTEETLSPSTSENAEPETPEVLPWMETTDYQEFCTGEVDIDPELQQAVDAVEIPDLGHVQFTNVKSDIDNPDMITVFFSMCSPAQGDDLRAIAEDLAIQVRASEIGETVSEMGVNASGGNPEGTENILRDSNFQLHLHDGGAARENGAYRAAWEAKN